MLDRLSQGVRRRLAERIVNVRKVLAIQPVKIRIVGRGVLGTVPPTPIASFRGEHGFVRPPAVWRPFTGSGRTSEAAPILRALERSSSVAQQIPRANILRVPDPYVEIGADP